MVLKIIQNGYCVHIDHDLKGDGITDFELWNNEYKNMYYLPNINLHITEGKCSCERTKCALGPNQKRVVMVGYSKSDTLLKLNTSQNKISGCEELGFNPAKPLITYAPAGSY